MTATLPGSVSVARMLLALLMLWGLLVPAIGANILARPLGSLLADIPALSAPRSIISDAAPVRGSLFVENVGQFPDAVLFQILGGAHAVRLTHDGLWLTLQEVSDSSSEVGSSLEKLFSDEKSVPRRVANLKLSFVGANPKPVLRPFGRSATKVSYLVGSDAQSWRSDVPTWTGVRYEEIYPGLDLELGWVDGLLDWRMIPRSKEGLASLRNVRLRVKGATQVRSGTQHLELETALGGLSIPLLKIRSTEGLAPSVSTQNSSMVVDAPFQKEPGPTGASRTQAAVLMDSPDDLVYATYVGGSGNDTLKSMAVDDEGCVYLIGETTSLDLGSLASGFDPSHNGARDAYVIKLDASGSSIVYVTYLGGSNEDYGDAVAVDSDGNAYAVGTTYSPDFPAAVGPGYDTSFNGGVDEAFAVKLNSTGTSLVYATFLGGTGYHESAHGVAVDAAGHAYVVGHTWSSNFPAQHGPGYDTSHNGGADAYLLKLHPSGMSIVYGTFLGGSSQEDARDVALDSAGRAYVVGDYSIQ